MKKEDISIKCVCNIRNNKIHISESDLQDLCRVFADGSKLQVTFEIFQPLKTDNQNKFYWGVIIPFMRKYFDSIGYALNNEDTHNYLVDKFGIKKQIVDVETGEMKFVSLRYSKYTKGMCMKYIDSINNWMISFSGMALPDPKIDIELK